MKQSWKIWKKHIETEGKARAKVLRLENIYQFEGGKKTVDFVNKAKSRGRW